MGRPLRSCGRRGRRCGAGGAASRAPGTAAGRGAAGRDENWELATCEGGGGRREPRRGEGSLGVPRVLSEEPGPSGQGSRETGPPERQVREGVAPEKNLVSVGNPDRTRRPQSVGPVAGREQSRGPRRISSCGECVLPASCKGLKDKVGKLPS